MADDDTRVALGISGKSAYPVREDEYKVTEAELNLLDNELSAFIAELLKT